ncbi:MAG: hypothetical protein IH919_09645 [Deltaproteobacteria bacterium]|nr:hypothetical protein [Deltaproteobacteria bacterium]
MLRRFHSDFLPDLHSTDATGHLGRLDPSCYDLHAGIQHVIIPLQRGERADRALLFWLYQDGFFGTVAALGVLVSAVSTCLVIMAMRYAKLETG